jgi:FKBP-type peptidyl-prolyl cis-trans isomerase
MSSNQPHSNSNEASSLLPPNEAQHQNLNDTSIQEEETVTVPLSLQRPEQQQQQQQQQHRPYYPQPAAEKAGAGILIRVLKKPNNANSKSNSKSIPNTTSKFASLSPQPGDTVKIHYEAFLFKDNGTKNVNNNNSNTNSSNSSNSNSNSNNSTNSSNNHNHNHNHTNLPEKPFDSSRKRNVPFCFVLGKEEVIEGLNVAVEHMKIGQLVEVTIPYLYAYGEQGYMPQIPPKSTLIFHVELLDFTDGDVLSDKKWQS